MRSKRVYGFSLIELVIVVVILAIVSAIAVPRIGRGAKGTDESALGQNLAILRTAIEMYAAEHAHVYPGSDGVGATFVDQLTKPTDQGGAVIADASAYSGIVYGPYLHKIPPLTVGTNAGRNDVSLTDMEPAVGGTAGWVYNYKTGRIIANCSDTSDDGTTAYNDW